MKDTRKTKIVIKARVGICIVEDPTRLMIPSSVPLKMGLQKRLDERLRRFFWPRVFFSSSFCYGQASKDMSFDTFNIKSGNMLSNFLQNMSFMLFKKITLYLR